MCIAISMGAASPPHYPGRLPPGCVRMHPVAPASLDKAAFALTLSSVVRSSSQLKGIVCLILSGAIFALTDGISKLLTSSYPPGEIMFFRAVFVLVRSEEHTSELQSLM